VKLPWCEGGDEQRPAFKPLDNDAGFLLDIEGRKVVALKLSGRIAKEVVGQASLTGGMLAKLAKLWRSVEPEHWLIVASMQNGLLNDPETFAALVAEGLSKASGVTVPASDLVIAGRNRVAKTEKQAELPIAT
jgi:hypothetical protein